MLDSGVLPKKGTPAMSVSTITARFISSVALASAMTVAHADVLEIDLGGAAVYSFNDFKSGSGRVDGSILAGRDVSLANYSVNTSNTGAYGDYAVVAGRDFTFTSGNVGHGSTYVGGTSYLNQSGTLNGPVTTGIAPADLNALSTSLTQTSNALAALTPTASTEQKWNGIFINGTNSQVEVINLDASWLDSSSWYSFSNLSAGATLIVNFLGDSATFRVASARSTATTCCSTLPTPPPSIFRMASTPTCWRPRLP